MFLHTHFVKLSLYVINIPLRKTKYAEKFSELNGKMNKFKQALF